ncbi:MAG: ATP-binding cassette domain-containing protein [Gemmatimonadales bacterium]|nr:ATP-binding cassette domain-containing protein [Gemmatimonadales bacterium]
MIALRDVHKAFGSKRVLDGVSLDVPEGQNTVIIGQSGAGKSVLLKLIVGLFTADAGAVEVDGAEVAALDPAGLVALRGTIGYVFQFAALFDSMTVRENLALGLERKGVTGEAQRARIAEALALVNLPGTEERYPAELSGGMRKRVGIARAIALRPKYILYDEPTSGLDPVTTAVMDELMVKTRDLGHTGVIVTHDMRSAERVGDRMAMLYRGRIRQAGTVAELRASDDPVVHRFIAGLPGEDEAEAAARERAEAAAAGGAA